MSAREPDGRALRLSLLYWRAVQRSARRVRARCAEPLRCEATALARRLWQARSLHWNRRPPTQDAP